jgi:hypothetical protein
MTRTPICDLLNIEHPIVLGSMGSATSPALVAAGLSLVQARTHLRPSRRGARIRINGW